MIRSIWRFFKYKHSVEYRRFVNKVLLSYRGWALFYLQNVRCWGCHLILYTKLVVKVRLKVSKETTSENKPKPYNNGDSFKVEWKKNRKNVFFPYNRYETSLKQCQVLYDHFLSSFSTTYRCYEDSKSAYIIGSLTKRLTRIK